MKNLEISVTKMVQKDNHKEGCDPKSCQDMGEIANYRGQGIEDVLKIADFFATGKPNIYDDRLEIAIQENVKGESPTQEEKLAFEKGEIDLYVADYSFYITKVERTSYTLEELTKSFPNLEQE